MKLFFLVLMILLLFGIGITILVSYGRLFEIYEVTNNIYIPEYNTIDRIRSGYGKAAGPEQYPITTTGIKRFSDSMIKWDDSFIVIEPNRGIFHLVPGQTTGYRIDSFYTFPGIQYAQVFTDRLFIDTYRDIVVLEKDASSKIKVVQVLENMLSYNPRDLLYSIAPTTHGISETFIRPFTTSGDNLVSNWKIKQEKKTGITWFPGQIQYSQSQPDPFAALTIPFPKRFDLIKGRLYTISDGSIAAYAVESNKTVETDITCSVSEGYRARGFVGEGWVDFTKGKYDQYELYNLKTREKLTGFGYNSISISGSLASCYYKGWFGTFSIVNISNDTPHKVLFNHVDAGIYYGSWKIPGGFIYQAKYEDHYAANFYYVKEQDLTEEISRNINPHSRKTPYQGADVFISKPLFCAAMTAVDNKVFRIGIDFESQGDTLIFEEWHMNDEGSGYTLVDTHFLSDRSK